MPSQNMGWYLRYNKEKESHKVPDTLFKPDEFVFPDMAPVFPFRCVPACGV